MTAAGGEPRKRNERGWTACYKTFSNFKEWNFMYPFFGLYGQL